MLQSDQQEIHDCSGFSLCIHTYGVYINITHTLIHTNEREKYESRTAAIYLQQ